VIGKKLGRNRIVEKIGEGGMGAVYRAQDEHLERDVAVKILPSGILDDKSARRLFRKEALALSKLSHPNIETIYDFDTQDDIDYLVIEYIQGTTLREILVTRHLSEKEIARFSVQLTDGLAAAHDRGIVHCDLKPGNLMVTPDGRLKILDFGLAKLSRIEIREESTGSSGEPVKARGTLPFMAPEQLKGEPVDPRTDIYALGNILYQMATGCLPFQESLPTALANEILTKLPPPPGRLRPDLSQRLEEIILKCLEKDPENRYQSVREIAVDLRRLPSAEISRPDIVRSPRRGWRAWRSAVISLAVAAAVLFAWLLWTARIGGPHRPEYTPKRIRSAERWEGEPVISPDGKWIAFASYRLGHKDIFITDADGRNPKELTNDDAVDSEPAWFPDSKTIAFARQEEGKSAICRVGFLNDTPTLLLSDASHPAISPDGTMIAFCRNLEGNSIQIGIGDFAPDSQNVSTIRMLAETREKAGRRLDPTWSPDGAEICYAGHDGLRIIKKEGGTPKSLHTGGDYDYDPCWSLVGNTIYFSSQREGILSLWYVSAEGGTPQRLTDGHGQESHPSISADGKFLIHAADMSRRYLMRLDRKSGKTPYQLPELDWAYGAIAPGGTSIAYARSVLGSGTNLWEQKLLNGLPDGPPHQIQYESGNAVLPAYSPDGNWIAYQYALEGRTDVCILPAKGGQSSRITAEGSFNGQPAWSPKGNQIVFRSNRTGTGQLWVATVKNGKAAGTARQLTHGDYDALLPAWSPDDRKIAFLNHKNGQADLCWVDVDGASPPVRLAEGINAMRVRWFGDSGELLVSARWGGGRIALWIYNPAANDRRPFPDVLDFGGPRAMAFFDVSADGNLLLYSKEDIKVDLWLLTAGSKFF